MRFWVQRVLAFRSLGSASTSQEKRGGLFAIGVGLVFVLLVSPIGKATLSVCRATLEPGSREALSLEERSHEVMAQVSQIKQQMRSAVRREDWRSVVALGEQIIAQHDIDGQVWRWMGTAFLQLGDYARAELAWEQALRDRVFRSSSLYGLACAQSLLGKTDQALTHLEEAYAKGFVSPPQVLAEQSFFPLRGEGRFVRMVEGESNWLVSQN